MTSFIINTNFNHFQIVLNLQYLMKHEKIALFFILSCKKVIKVIRVCHNSIKIIIGLVFEMLLA